MPIGRLVVGGAALVLASAFSKAASLPLFVLNGGPSSDSVPSSASDRVATVAYPRQIANTNVVPTFGDIFPALTDATEVEQSGNLGIRWRSAALWPANQFTNDLGQVAVMAQTGGFDATAADSFILFLNEDDAARIIDLHDLANFISNTSAGADYLLFFLSNAALNGGAGYFDGDLTEANLDDGIFIDKTELDAATPNGGGGVGQYADFNLAIVVFSDGAFDAVNPAVATEWICVDNDGEFVAPTNADFDFDNRTIRIHTSQQLLDDFSLDNPADTFAGNISVSDFRVLLTNGTTVQTLATFLNGLEVPNTVASVGVLPADSETPGAIEIQLANEVTDEADIATFLATRIGFLGADIDSITGDNQTNATATYQFMNRPKNVPYPPEITLQPVAQIVATGGTAMFAVSAIGDPPLEYQWRRDGQPLQIVDGFKGANSSMLSFEARINDVGVYDCLVTNAVDQAASHGAILAVRPSCAGDANGDGIVDFADLNAVVSQFNTACP